MFDVIRSLLAIPILLGLVWLILSEDRKLIPWRTIFWGIGLQLFLAVLIFMFPPGVRALNWLADFVTKFLALTNAGSKFLFGNLIDLKYIETFGFQFAFIVLPTVIFFSSFMAILYHWKVMQPVIELVAKLMSKTMRISGVESLACAANIFLGQTESPLLIRPYLKDVTRSEMGAIMTGGFATIAGGVMAGYIAMGVSAKYLIAASVMSAPAALVMAKIAFPEREKPVTFGNVKLPRLKMYDNTLDAAASGASDGMKLALNIAAMLIAFLALLAGVDWFLGWFAGVFESVTGFSQFPSSLRDIFGIIFSPFAWLIGIPWKDAGTIGYLIGTQISTNEFVAYLKLSELKEAGILTERTIAITTYAMCTFANFGSIAVQIGGIGAIVPEKRSMLTSIGFKAMICGIVASWMTASFASLFL